MQKTLGELFTVKLHKINDGIRVLVPIEKQFVSNKNVAIGYVFINESECASVVTYNGIELAMPFWAGFWESRLWEFINTKQKTD